MDATTLILLAALTTGTPTTLQNELLRSGLFCRALDQVEFAIELVEAGGSIKRIVEGINSALGARTCIFSNAKTVRTGALALVSDIPSRPKFAIYRAFVQSFIEKIQLTGSRTPLLWEINDLSFRYTVQYKKENLAAP